MPLHRKFNQEGQPFMKEEPADLQLKLKPQSSGEQPRRAGARVAQARATLPGPRPRTAAGTVLSLLPLPRNGPRPAGKGTRGKARSATQGPGTQQVLRECWLAGPLNRDQPTTCVNPTWK